MLGSAQISVYPLRQDHLGPAIDAVGRALRDHGLDPRTGPMSTYVAGDVQAILAALADGFSRASEHGQVVMSITVSNACPIPDRDGAQLV